MFAVIPRRVSQKAREIVGVVPVLDLPSALGRAGRLRTSRHGRIARVKQAGLLIEFIKRNPQTVACCRTLSSCTERVIADQVVVAADQLREPINAVTWPKRRCSN